MSQNIFGNSRSNMSRDQRWEARRQAKFSQSGTPPNDTEILVAPENFIENSKPFEFSNHSQSLLADPGKNMNFYQIEPPKPHSLQLDPGPEIREQHNSLSYPNKSISASPNPLLIQKKAYGSDLKKQAEEDKNRKKRPPTPKNDYFPFGKPGAGAPMLDPQGNIIAKRPPKYNENDPNFMNPGDFYKNVSGLSHSRSQQVIGFQEGGPSRPIQMREEFMQQQTSPKYVKSSKQFQPSPQFQSAPQFNFGPSGAGFQVNPGFSGPSGVAVGQGPQLSQVYQPSSQYPPQYGSQSYPQYPPQYHPQPPPQYSSFIPGQQANPGYNESNFAGYQNPGFAAGAGSQFFAPQPDYAALKNYSEAKSSYSEDRQIRNASDSPKPFFAESSEENQKSVEKAKKQELGKILLEQAEEKRRRQEEEKRQKVLEERLEEERLARQRREIEEQRRQEELKGRKRFQEVQEFNQQLVLEPKAKQKRQRTPYEPPAEHPGLMPMAPMAPLTSFPPTLPRAPQESQVPLNISAPALPLVQESRRQETTLSLPLPDDYLRLKQDYEQKHLQLKQEIINLKSDNMDKESKQIESLKEIQRLRDEFRQKELMDELRQKEVLNALHKTKTPNYELPTKLPPYKPLPYKQVEGRGDASLSLDPMRSLPSNSKLIPLPTPEMNFPTIPVKEENLKKAIQLDSLFPSLPDAEMNNVSFTSNKTAGSSIGIEKLGKKNDERLKFLEKIEGDPQDELKRLDEILFKFQAKPSLVDSRRSNRSRRLENILEVDEANYSLPRSRASEASLKWNKDWVDDT